MGKNICEVGAEEGGKEEERETERELKMWKGRENGKSVEDGV